MFFTSRTTLRNYPKSLLFKLVDIHDSLIVYFVDRDPEFFYIILHFYRVGVRNVPTYPTIHRKLQIEGDFYEQIRWPTLRITVVIYAGTVKSIFIVL